jgi:hypothetical protein
MDQSISEEEYLARGIRLRAKVYVVFQILGLLSAGYLAHDSFDFVFDEIKYLLMFTGVMIYLLSFLALTLRIAFKKELRMSAAKKQLTLIVILDLVPVFVLILLALTDIF